MLDCLEVAGGGVDAEAEEVVDAAYVAAGGVDLVQDPVLPQRLGTERDAFPGEAVPDGTNRGAVRLLTRWCWCPCALGRRASRLSATTRSSGQRLRGTAPITASERRRWPTSGPRINSLNLSGPRFAESPGLMSSEGSVRFHEVVGTVPRHGWHLRRRCGMSLAELVEGPEPAALGGELPGTAANS